MNFCEHVIESLIHYLTLSDHISVTLSRGAAQRKIAAPRKYKIFSRWTNRVLSGRLCDVNHANDELVLIGHCDDVIRHFLSHDKSKRKSTNRLVSNRKIISGRKNNPRFITRQIHIFRSISRDHNISHKYRNYLTAT